MLSQKCDVVIAIDYSFESLQVLKNKSLDNVLIVQADLCALPFKDEIFDACVCANTIQHLRPGAPQNQAISELKRVTRNKGVISVSVHHYSRDKKARKWKKEGKPGQKGIDYIFRFSKADLQSIMSGSKIIGMGFYGLLRVPFFGSKLQSLSALLLGRIASLLAYGHMLRAVLKKHKL